MHSSPAYDVLPADKGKGPQVQRGGQHSLLRFSDDPSRDRRASGGHGHPTIRDTC